MQNNARNEMNNMKRNFADDADPTGGVNDEVVQLNNDSGDGAGMSDDEQIVDGAQAVNDDPHAA